MLACIKPILVCGFQKSAFHKESKKTYVPKEKALDVPTYILKHMMNGQVWPEGNAEFHQWLNVPTLLIFGQDDQLVSLEEEIEMNMVIYGSKLEVIENASHMVMMEKPDEVSQLIYDFLLQGRAVVRSAIGPEVRSESRSKRTLSASSVRSFPGHLLNAKIV
ncbi:protein ABHD8-like [Lingula anatina]|uniref:Protein ABHD8-like n=1 Tax=Lingula anatina TaxID=7574 RepID=A0A1S3HY03_LINAN|nr:protein ABHD8-like [Lingula anatina]|eukprot:XP_013390910.1 protein ABHD8-like [Lingula anatina]